jgi:PKD repeat protein
MESYYTWYYFNKTVLHPMFKYDSKKISAYFYPEVKGMQQTFTDSMSYNYAAPVNYAVFSLEPVAPAYPTLVNSDDPAKNLEIVYGGADYKTIGTMMDFSALTGNSPPSTQTALMKGYLEFFDLNIAGPYPLFHVANTSVCQSQQVAFTDDSYDLITSRSWEFQGGNPAVSNEINPVVTYDTTGKFDVKLTVSNGVGTKTILKQKYIQVDHCSGTEEHAAASLFRIFPNPASDRVNIEVNRNISGSCRIMLFDLAGCKVREIQQAISPGNRIVFDLSGLGKGLYFLRMHAGELNATLKVIKN